MNNDLDDSHDPIVDHLMQSHAFKVVIWSFIMALTAVGLAVISLNALATSDDNFEAESPDYRLTVLRYGGGPLAACVPVAAMLALPFSRRLR